MLTFHLFERVIEMFFISKDDLLALSFEESE